MRMGKTFFPVLACAAVLGLAACEVEQTEQAEAPEVEVDPGRWPAYDVDWADVDVGMTERTVDVPVVRIEQEQRQVSVPYIDVNPPGAAEREERTISMEVDVPTAGYSLEITEIRAAEDNLWVIAELRQPEGDTASAQVVTRVADQVVINAPEDLDVRTVVVGERPEGVYNQQHRFVDSMSALDQTIPQNARVIYNGDAGSADTTQPTGG